MEINRILDKRKTNNSRDSHSVTLYKEGRKEGGKKGRKKEGKKGRKKERRRERKYGRQPVA